MVVCKFFQQGFCKFGDNCRYEHGREGRAGGQQYYSQGSHGDYTTGRYDQRSNRYDQRSNRYDQGSNRYDQGSNRFDQGSNRFDQGSNRFDQGSNRFDQGSNRFDQKSNRHDQGSNRFSHFNSPEFSRRNEDSSYKIDRRNTVQNSDSGYGNRYHGNGGDRVGRGRRDDHRRENDDQDLTNEEILESISEDMEIWEKGNIWLFSCYGYAREMKSFPGLEDLSSEEIRLSAYEANALGQSSVYLNWLMDLEKDYRMKRSQLRSPDAPGKASLLSSIEQIKQSSLQSNCASGAFGSGGSLAGNTSGQSNALFGSSSNGFTQNIFSNSGTVATNSGTFGATFAQGQPIPISGAFGSATPGFSFTSSTPVAPVVQRADNAFGFGAGTPQNAFGASTISAIAADSVSLNGATGVSVHSAAQNLDIYQTLAAQSPKRGSDGTEKLYTPVADLTSEELMQFESPRFMPGLIPTKPPPRHLV